MPPEAIEAETARIGCGAALKPAMLMVPLADDNGPEGEPWIWGPRSLQLFCKYPLTLWQLAGVFRPNIS